jgi:hypothetical protein
MKFHFMKKKSRPIGIFKGGKHSLNDRQLKAERAVKLVHLLLSRAAERPLGRLAVAESSGRIGPGFLMFFNLNSPVLSSSMKKIKIFDL